MTLAMQSYWESRSHLVHQHRSIWTTKINWRSVEMLNAFSSFIYNEYVPRFGPYPKRLGLVCSFEVFCWIPCPRLFSIHLGEHSSMFRLRFRIRWSRAATRRTWYVQKERVLFIINGCCETWVRAWWVNTYREDHAWTLLNCSAATQKCNDEYDGTNHDHDYGSRP